MRLSKSVATLATVAAAMLLVLLVAGAEAAPTVVPLGTADSFVVLAGGGITNTGPTTLNGDMGTFPTTTITGAGSIVLTGTNHAGDGVTQGAKPDLITAYNNAAGQGPTSPIVADLGGQNLTPGIYNSASSIGLTGALTLNGGGDPNAVFVFQAGSDLTTASASSVNLVNGAQSCNVFWQIGNSASLGTGSSFRGTMIAMTDISASTGATIDGRLLARNGAVTLDTNTITKSTCATAQPAPAREIYCDPVTGQDYDLITGQNTAPPYASLGLVLAQVDPVTGAKTCAFVRENALATATTAADAAALVEAEAAAATVATTMATAARTEQAARVAAAQATANRAAAARLAATQARAAKTAAARAAAAKPNAVKGAAVTQTLALPAVRHVGLTG